MRKSLYGVLSLGTAAVLVWLFAIAPIVTAGVVVAAIATLIVLPDLLRHDAADSSPEGVGQVSDRRVHPRDG
ncbi:MAG: hypothetical protein ACRDO1_02735 [Nocardioidaceae bacterium]